MRQEAGNFMQVKNTRKSSQRLKDCLIEMDMAVPLVLLMAQQGSCVVYQVHWVICVHRDIYFQFREIFFGGGGGWGEVEIFF